MEILKIDVLRGPNYWSDHRKKLIVLTLNLHDYENIPTNLIQNFTQALQNLLPSLNEHRCSYGFEGGFLKRVEEGTWLGHVVEHVALELQWISGMKCGFGRTRPTSQRGIYKVVFAYEIENAGIYAAHAAVKIVQNLAKLGKYNLLAQDLTTLKNIFETEQLGPSTESIIKEAESRDIPYTRLDKDSLIMLGQGINQKIICSTVSSRTTSIGVDLVHDKVRTKEILAAGLIPVPEGILISSLKEIDHAITLLGFPLVIKPQNGNHGRGITTNIKNKEKAIFAYSTARKFSKNVLIEKYIKGFDYRFLVINYKLIAVAKRTPAYIVGDGISTIQQLIDEVNQHPQRGEGHENFLTKITIEEVTLGILNEKGLTSASILPQGEILYLKNAANISSGGTAMDVTDFVHPENISLTERVARLVNLDVCGIDIITEDISKPIKAENGAVLEVNAAPGFRMHLSPCVGKKHNVATPFVDMLYPNGSNGRIPIVAVTGTSEKTTLVKLIANFATQAGHCVGFTTKDGMYIDNLQISQEDCSCPLNTVVVLRDPLVDFAVFECSGEAILRSGLGFDKCNIGIVTSISEDHLDKDDINSLDELVRVNSIIPRNIMKNGFAILNADDDLVYEMMHQLSCNIALFSMSNNNQRIINHCANGGLAAFIERDALIVQKGEQKNVLANMMEKSMVKDILPTALTGIVSGFSISDISRWLRAFEPSPEKISDFV